MTFEPANVVAQQDEGESRTFRLNARLNGVFDQGLYLRVSDTDSVFNPNVAVEVTGEATGIATLQTLTSVSAGRHRGALSVALCRDAACKTQYSGSPVLLPYDIQVDSLAEHLTPLVRAASKDWETFQGDAAHTGAMPITGLPEKFARRWRLVFGDVTNVSRLSHVVTQGGMVYFATEMGWQGERRDGAKYLVAIDEATGREAWRFTYPGDVAPAPPAVHGDLVYVAANQGGSYTLWVLDARTGELRFQSGIGTQWRYYQASVFFDGHLYQHGGSNNGGLVSFSAVSHSFDWGNYLWDVTFPGAVAVDEDYVYAVMYGTESMGTFVTPESEGALVLLNRATGQLVKKIRPHYSLASPGLFGVIGDTSPTPVLAGSSSVLLGYLNANHVPSERRFRLEKIDIASEASAWRLDFPIASTTDVSAYWSRDPRPANPVLVNGVLYVVNPGTGQLEARRESDGSLVWAWTPAAEDQTELVAWSGSAIPVAISNVVFVPTSKYVYGVDIASGKTVWRHGNTGHLAVSPNGVLYISGKDRLDAINLN